MAMQSTYRLIRSAKKNGAQCGGHQLKAAQILIADAQHMWVKRTLNRLLKLTALVMLTSLEASAQESIEILQPAPQEISQASDQSAGTGSQTSRAQADAEPYVSRTGNVELNVDVFLDASPNEGTWRPMAGNVNQAPLGLAFFPDVRFDIQVVAESHPQTDTLTISGQFAGQPMATFTLTITPESYLVTLQDFDGNKLYRVVGDTNTGAGQVTEIDLRKMPPVSDSPPIIPPGN
jgi:hypothetical protein